MTGGHRQTKSVDGVVANHATKVEPTPEVEALQGSITWEAPNFERAEKGIKWYLLVSAILLAAVGYSVWQRDWFFIVIILIVTAVAIWYLRSVKPVNTSYRIDQQGLTVGNHLHPFSEIHSFWIVYHKNAKNLNIVFIKRYLPALSINLGDTDPVLVRSFLATRVPEQETRGEGMIDKLIRVLGF